MNRPAAERGRILPHHADVLTHAANGYSTPQISTALHLSERTVRQRLYRAYQILAARDRAHAVALAIAAGVLVLHGDGTVTACTRDSDCAGQFHTTACAAAGVPSGRRAA